MGIFVDVPLKILKKHILLENMKDFSQERKGEALSGQGCANREGAGRSSVSTAWLGCAKVFRAPSSSPVSWAPSSSSSLGTGS